MTEYEHDTRGLEERVFDALSEMLDTTGAELAPVVAPGAAVPSQSEIEARQAEIAEDRKTVRAHWSAAGVRPDGHPPACVVCGQGQPCETIRALARKYDVA
ncbi:hypothetical protein [Aeromicrobium ginsengisoli]|uniref:Uncharacterized protein n=1 Tax=Aeromicrobium ginsengisoli TaxID=363867 RepID=A0A5M4FEK8_9ACTN|nr:hypothetical protein [Aeromicrobium ginsengisoli]KAA1397785.1 hypothetical protein ESP70_010590 [Aeromicrobium ginsengisoli]